MKINDEKNSSVLIPQVFNAHVVGTASKPGRVYVGRPTKWGNPYHVGSDGTREQIIEYYRLWLEKQLFVDPNFLRELIGKDLICWCAPKPCHADVLLEYANAVE